MLTGNGQSPVGEGWDARVSADAAAARDALLADASTLLASSLDYERTLGEVAELAVRRFAHWCAIDLVEEDDEIRRLAMADADPVRARRTWDLYKRYPGGHDRVVGVQDVRRTRRPKIVEVVTDDTLRLLATGPAHLDALRALGVVSYIAVPLLLRDRVLGAVSFALAGTSRRFTAADLAAAVRLASKIVFAIDNARLFRDLQTAVRHKDETLAFLDTVLRTAPVGLAFLDRALRVVRINDALGRMAGRRAEDQLDRPANDVLPAEWRPLIAYFPQVFDSGQPLTDVEWSGTLPGHPGRTQHLLASYYPIRDQRGAVNWVGIVVSDVTERKRVEEAGRQTQKLESIGLLAGGIAHDFNNLLTGILGNASLARRALPPESPAAPMLADVVRASERAAALTSQLLAYAGKGRFYVQAIDLAALVRDITSLIRTSVPKKADVRVDIEGALPAIEADAGQLQQVVMNLVINAAEAIADGPGTVTVVVDAVDVDAAELHDRFAAFGLQPGRYVRLEVRDTGLGMDAGTRIRVFDPFFTTKFTGRGLGLAAVLGIVRGHRGGIAVESEPGRGTTFTVLIPALAHAAAVEPPLPTPSPLGNGLVLVADDDEVVRRLARQVLEECGYRVIEATNGAEAVELAGRSSAELALVLLDMTMPVMSGDEAVRHLKRLRPELPVLAMSGYGELEASRRFTGTGVDGFLQKPYTAEQLLARLETLPASR